MNYRPRTAPGEAEPCSTYRRAPIEIRQYLEEEHDFASLSSILGALRWLAFRTRPDICWAVTR
eukprot:12490057-Prorocentrum_lima.AAC.1